MESDEKEQELRKRAQARYHSRRAGEQTRDYERMDDVVHELEVHQIELELQNDELRQAQARLEASLERYQELFDLAPVGYATLHANGVIIKANLTASTLFGVNRLQLNKARLHDYVTSDYRDILHRHLRRVFTGAGHETCELELVRGKDARFFARLESTVQNMSETQEPECLTAITDITEQKLREEALRKSQEQLRQFVEQAPISIAMLNRELRYIAVSHRWVVEYGRGFTHLAGMSHYDVHPDLPEHWKKVHRDALAGAFVSKEEEQWTQNDGSSRWLRWAVHPWSDEKGDIGGIIISLEDITERKQSENALRDADRLKDEFIATLAHELRNPMAPIRNAVQLFKLRDMPDPALRAARDIIDRQSRHLARLVDDLLDVSRITQRRLELRPERVELGGILEKIIEACQPELGSAGLELNLLLPEQSIHMDADPVRLTQLFVNLLNNACKYTTSGGRIELAVERDGAEVKVSVRDSGRGIPAERLHSLFEMFSRAGSDMEKLQGGLGIGLWLARRLAEMHGGSIEARSEGLGKGSEFIVRLPALPEASAARLPQQHDQGCVEPGRARQILVADDNRDIVDTMVMLLEAAGHQVVAAHDGQEAVELAERYRPDVVLLDIGMPGLDGNAACRRIRGQSWGKHTTIIALTGWGQEGDRRGSNEAGFDNHMIKPVDPDALLRLLAELPA